MFGPFFNVFKFKRYCEVEGQTSGNAVTLSPFVFIVLAVTALPRNESCVSQRQVAL